MSWAALLPSPALHLISSPRGCAWRPYHLMAKSTRKSSGEFDLTVLAVGATSMQRQAEAKQRKTSTHACCEYRSNLLTLTFLHFPGINEVLFLLPVPLYGEREKRSPTLHIPPFFGPAD